ncbi:SLC13 family permease [Pseudooceanicola marinus]|uniref:SLC13 family permease n=1 Tax=Pseudooceanicola marinus TaxID=396013 RepID=UPI001CD3E55E|nr:SLC13 family permease [Pseudooceanicola marinus]MCA1336346.1 anion permease [Pseudooceanicola marinus]
MTLFKNALVALIALLALTLALANPMGLPAVQARTLGLVLFTLSLWGTGVVPGYLASLTFLTGVVILELAPPEAAFSGFTSQAMWLIVSGFVIGEAIRSSGLGHRLAFAIGPHLSRSYGVLLLGLMGLAMVLGFLMPSSLGRAVVLMPVGMALAERLGFDKGSNGRIGIALIIAFGSHMAGYGVLPSNIPNVVLAGSVERIYGLRLGYAEWLSLHYPVLGLLKGLVITWLVARLYPARVAELGEASDDNTSEESSARQIWLLAVLLATLGFWMTDTLHGISPAWIGMAASIVLLLPRVGFLSPPDFRRSSDFATLLFVSGALGLGAVVKDSGLGEVIAHAAVRLLPLAEGQDFLNYLSLSGLSMVTGVFTTIPGVPAVLTSLAGELSEATGLTLDAVVMTQVVGFSTVIFPYQAGPLIVAMGLAGESLSHLLRMTLALTLVTVVALIPLNYLWWQVMGMF